MLYLAFSLHHLVSKAFAIYALRSTHIYISTINKNIEVTKRETRKKQFLFLH